MAKIQIIIGSNRPGRVSDRVAKWVASEVSKTNEAEVVDLKDYELPFFDELISPQYNPERTPTAPVQKWLDKVGEADGYVIVTPEYNRSFPAVLKNAIDYIDFQLAKKPVAIVAHGSTGGAQAVAQLRGVIPAMQAVSVPTATFLSARAGEVIDEEGNLSEELKANPHGPQTSLEGTIRDLVWYTDALKVAREKQ